MVRSRFSPLASPAYKTLSPTSREPRGSYPNFFHPCTASRRCYSHVASCYYILSGFVLLPFPPPSALVPSLPLPSLSHHCTHPPLPVPSPLLLETTGPWTVQISVGR